MAEFTSGLQGKNPSFSLWDVTKPINMETDLLNQLLADGDHHRQFDTIIPSVVVEEYSSLMNFQTNMPVPVPVPALSNDQNYLLERNLVVNFPGFAVDHHADNKSNQMNWELADPGAPTLEVPRNEFKESKKRIARRSSGSAIHNTKDPSASRRSRGKRVKSNEKEEDEKPKEVVHVRAKRSQATDSHSVAERVRRGKINEKLRCLKNIVPSCSKTMPMTAMLDETINYVHSLHNQVEFLFMKLTAASSLYGGETLMQDREDEVYGATDLERMKREEAYGYGYGEDLVAAAAAGASTQLGPSAADFDSDGLC